MARLSARRALNTTASETVSTKTTGIAKSRRRFVLVNPLFECGDSIADSNPRFAEIRDGKVDTA